MFGTCDTCHKEVLAQNCFRLGYDLLYCPECYENIVHEGRLDGRDSGDSVNSGLNSGSPIKGRVNRKNTSPKETEKAFPVVNHSYLLLRPLFLF